MDKVVEALGGDREKLVIDLSCRRKGEGSWFVAMDKWQMITDMEVNEGSFAHVFIHFSYTTTTKLIHQTRVDKTAGAILLRVSNPCR